MLFLFEFLVSASVYELDLQSLVEIRGNEDDDFFTIIQNNLQIQMEKDSDILMTGISTENNGVNISITDTKNPLKLVFENLSLSNEYPAIYIEGNCTVNIIVDGYADIYSLNSYPILLAHDSNLILEGQTKDQTINIGTYSNYSLIGGNGNVLLKNIKINQQSSTYLFSGIESKTISIDSCNINLFAYKEAIGGPQTNHISIQSSILTLSSQTSSPIGNNVNKNTQISIESSDIELHSAKSFTIATNKVSFGESSYPLFTLSNLASLGASSLTVFGERINYQRKVELGKSDESVSMSLPLANEKYFLMARIGDDDIKLRNGANKDGKDTFTIGDGDNFFNTIEIITTNKDNEDGKKEEPKKQNVALILGLAIGIPIFAALVAFCIAATIICIRKKRNPLVISAVLSQGDSNLDQPLNGQELEEIH